MSSWSERVEEHEVGAAAGLDVPDPQTVDDCVPDRDRRVPIERLRRVGPRAERLDGQ